MPAARALAAWTRAFDERAHRRLVTQFVHEYRAAFDDLVAAQRSAGAGLQPTLVDDLIDAHRHFATAYQGRDAAIDALRALWDQAAARLITGAGEPLSADAIARAGAQFGHISAVLKARARGVGVPTAGRAA